MEMTRVKILAIVLVCFVAMTFAILSGCGKDTGNGVGGKVIITGAGN